MASKSGGAPVIVWFRQDLRLSDQPALAEAATTGQPVLPVFIWDEDAEGEWVPGAASKWWLHHSLKALETSLGRHHLPLILKTGKTQNVLRALMDETGADRVYALRRYEPAQKQLETRLAKALGEQLKLFHGNLLFAPGEITTGSGEPYKVFTPFWQNLRDTHAVKKPVDEPSCKTPANPPASQKLSDFQLLPEHSWHEKLHQWWTPGEKGAWEKLEYFLDKLIDDYQSGRETPGVYGTSRLSPHLHWGEISPRQLWWRIRHYQHRSKTRGEQIHEFLRELGWREFAHHVLDAFPDTPREPFREKFKNFEHRRSQKDLKAWQWGRTGYPIVDAGMRELWETGWMHNRVRMVVASFLYKDLRLHWHEGEDWFWDTLVDADLASNTLNWQWAAGCGLDAAPFFRIFNPVRQAQKFDPDGDYIRKWCPELKDLPDKYLAAPWEAPGEVLEKAGVTLGKDYPEPMVDHKSARKEALALWEKIK